MTYRPIEHSLDYPHCDDNTVPEDSGLRAYFRPLAEGLKKLGTSVHLFSGDWFKSLLEEAGFTEVEVYTYKVSSWLPFLRNPLKRWNCKSY